MNLPTDSGRPQMILRRTPNQRADIPVRSNIRIRTVLTISNTRFPSPVAADKNVRAPGEAGARRSRRKWLSALAILGSGIALVSSAVADTTISGFLHVQQQ